MKNQPLKLSMPSSASSKVWQVDRINVPIPLPPSRPFVMSFYSPPTLILDSAMWLALVSGIFPDLMQAESENVFICAYVCPLPSLWKGYIPLILGVWETRGTTLPYLSNRDHPRLPRYVSRLSHNQQRGWADRPRCVSLRHLLCG